VIELGRLALAPGQARSLEFGLSPHRVRLGELGYEPLDGESEARLDISRTSGGYALRLRFRVELGGPCVRCLDQARLGLDIDAREVDQPASGDEELRSPYVSEARLDVERWADDAVVLALPAQPLCRPDCAGLCPVCGESLNDADPADHRHERGGDPRLAKLRGLKLE
jgi:uncharacterized protein